VKRASEIRTDFTVESIAPRKDALDTLNALKKKRLKIGLISDCSDEVPAAWDSTPFAALIDVAIFSCSVAMKKPDPRIFRTATQQLGLKPQDCLYVGDGSSHELTGAKKVGMHPVLIRVPYETGGDAYRIDAEEWHGPTVSSLKEILDLLE
jgi:putative hydrolase of the HAD superfamily